MKPISSDEDVLPSGEAVMYERPILTSTLPGWQSHWCRHTKVALVITTVRLMGRDWVCSVTDEGVVWSTLKVASLIAVRSSLST